MKKALVKYSKPKAMLSKARSVVKKGINKNKIATTRQ